MPTPKNKFKIGKKVSSAARQTSKKHNTIKSKITQTQNSAKIPTTLFYRKKAPFSKTKKIYPVRKTTNADIVVKRSTYSKTTRAAVLADAAARQRLIEIGGENTINIIREFDVDMSDDELAKKTGIKPSEVRVVLNRLHNRGVFAYTRVRDKDSGWYSYIWKMDEERLKDVGGAMMNMETTQIMSRDGYGCVCCNQQKMMDFSEAVDARFRCNKCGSCLEFFDSKQHRVGNL